MDQSVLDALNKWPNVPECFGWLALDRRGQWRMRNEESQSQQLPGEIIKHAALHHSITKNYARDSKGRFFFQNGPQRVYVDLETTPFVARTDPLHQFVLHDGKLMTDMNEVCLTEQGQLVLRNSRQIAMLDDRDLAGGEHLHLE